MRDSLLDRCVLVFVMMVALLLLFLLLAESPSGQGIPASVVAASMMVSMIAVAVGVVRSNAPGWSKPVVIVVGTLFILLTLWSLLDPPLDYRRTLSSATLGLVLLATGFEQRRRTKSDASVAARSHNP